MTVVALTGGIAAGKSTVSAVLAECGAVVLDADMFARQAVSPGSPGVEAVRERFGDGVMTPEGGLDRAGLGKRVFGDAVAKAELEAIIHPIVRALSSHAVATAVQEHPEKVLIYDIPLLAEARDPGEFDLIVLIDASADQRRSRLEAERGMTREEAEARVLAQATDEDRRALADVVIDASQSVKRTQTAARQFYDAVHDAWPDRLASVPQLFPLPET